jgi:hypothetical protein
LYEVPLPFEPRWPSRLRARATVRYLSLLAAELGFDLPALVRELLASRYRMGYGSGRDGGEAEVEVEDEAVGGEADNAGDKSGKPGESESLDGEDGVAEDEWRAAAGGGSVATEDDRRGAGEDEDDDNEAFSGSSAGDRGSAATREWLPWCREPAADATLQRAKGRAFAAAARAHRAVLQRASQDPAGVRTAVEGLVELAVASAVGPRAVPLFLCACFSPAPTRVVLLGPRPLDLGKCVAQWDFFE